MIKNVTFKIKGDHDILMHSTSGMNPYTELSRQLKELNKKRSKTEEDKLAISDIEFQQSLYWDDEKQRVYLPGENIEKCIREGAQLKKRGKDIQRYVRVLEEKPELHYAGGPKTLEELTQDMSHRDLRPVAVQRAKVMRTRARFAPGWWCEFTVQFDDSNVDLAIIKTSLEDAGAYIGIGDFRPRYGTFIVV